MLIKLQRLDAKAVVEIVSILPYGFDSIINSAILLE